MVKSWLFDIFNYPYGAAPATFDPQLCQELYDWHTDLWVGAEELGFDGVFFSEHHFTSYNISPSPNLLVAAVAARTDRMRLGVMANIVPFHNPRALAEEVAMLDYLTNGRLEVGLGRGVDEQEFLRDKVVMEETRGRFEESMEIMHAAWRNPVFSHHGKYYDYDDVTIWPRPRQQPNPPVWVTALSPTTVEWAGREGYKMAHTFMPVAETKDMFDLYRKSAEDAGNSTAPDQLGLMRQVFVADSDQEARDIGEPALNQLFGLFKEAAVFQDLDNVPEGYEFYSSFFRPFSSGPVSWETLTGSGIVCVGSPKTVRDQLIAQAEELECGNIINAGIFGSMTKEQTVHSAELYAEEIIPALRSVNA